MPAKRVVLFTLGGTIAMAGTEKGAVARLGGHELLTSLESLDRDIGIEVRDVAAVPSAGLSFGDVLDVVDLASQAVLDGAAGVVLTQGTDTLEETAYLIDLVWTHDAPFVVTGAMRNPTLAGPDGPANLLAAVQLAASDAGRGRGALVVLADDIHAARYVRKAHTSSTGAFVSPDLGPIGHLVEAEPRFLADLVRHPPLAVPSRSALAITHIALHTVVLDDRPAPLADLDDTHDGLVLAGFGVGHAPPALVPVLADLAATMPVVLASRTGAGSIFHNTYGAPGSERDLLEHDLIPAGFLHPYKARILLRLLVAADVAHTDIAATFAERGR